jgi:hypothetical protein
VTAHYWGQIEHGENGEKGVALGSDGTDDHSENRERTPQVEKGERRWTIEDRGTPIVGNGKSLFVTSANGGYRLT